MTKNRATARYKNVFSCITTAGGDNSSQSRKLLFVASSHVSKFNLLEGLVSKTVMEVRIRFPIIERKIKSQFRLVVQPEERVLVTQYRAKIPRATGSCEHKMQRRMFTGSFSDHAWFILLIQTSNNAVWKSCLYRPDSSMQCFIGVFAFTAKHQKWASLSEIPAERASSPGFQALAYLSVMRTRSHFATVSSDDTFYTQPGCMLHVFSISCKLQLWNPHSKNFTPDFTQHQPHPAEGLRSGLLRLQLSYAAQEHRDKLCVLFSFSHAPLPHSLPNFVSSSTERTSGLLMHTVLTVWLQILLSHQRGSSWSNTQKHQA